jgi:aminoglycoside phosphotransferase (APT) family kinase protein
MLVLDRGIDHLSTSLLDYLRQELGDCALSFQTALTPLVGAHEAHMYSFILNCSRPEFSRPVVLRLYPEGYGKRRVELETAVQNCLADAGFQVPRVYMKCIDKSILGGTFLIMEFLTGEPMLSAPIETLPYLLGKTHAALHRVIPESISTRAEFSNNEYRLEGRLRGLKKNADRHSWLLDSVNWLLDSQPAQPAQLAICHGDFHPLNILVSEGRVTGVLDWPGFIIADPVLDVAFTTVLLSIAGDHVFPQINIDEFVREYLATYMADNSIDLTNFEYYKVLRCVTALVDGIEGQELWRRPPILRSLVEYIQSITGIEVQPPPSMP